MASDRAIAPGTETADAAGASLLAAWRAGDETAGDRLFALIQGELEHIASFLLRRENRAVSIVTGDLVNEAVLKLLQSEGLAFNDRAHVLALSARVMRHVLIDAARRKSAQKRDAALVALTTGCVDDQGLSFELRALDAALARLSAIDPKRAEIVELRYFAGMTVEEIAAATNSSPATVKRIWASTRAWLKDAIRDALPK